MVLMFSCIVSSAYVTMVPNSQQSESRDGNDKALNEMSLTFRGMPSLCQAIWAIAELVKIRPRAVSGDAQPVLDIGRSLSCQQRLQVSKLEMR